MRKLCAFVGLCLLLIFTSATSAKAQYALLQPLTYSGNAASEAFVSTPQAFDSPPRDTASGTLAYARSVATAVDPDNIISFNGSANSRLVIGQRTGTYVNGTASAIFLGGHNGYDSSWVFKNEAAVSEGLWLNSRPWDILYGVIRLEGNASRVMEFSEVVISQSWVTSENGWLRGIIFTRDSNNNDGILAFGVNHPLSDEFLPPIFSPGGLVVDVFESAPAIIHARAQTNIATMGPIYNDSTGGNYSSTYAFMVTDEEHLPPPMGISGLFRNFFIAFQPQ